MIAAYLKVAENINDELISLEKTHQRIYPANQARQSNALDSDLLINAIA
ncbi:hypothetical protein [Synechococcus sp. BDU 130192]|nr:hypothetical protein [Synechococcus sp. BDU 130192]